MDNNVVQNIEKVVGEQLAKKPISGGLRGVWVPEGREFISGILSKRKGDLTHADYSIIFCADWDQVFPFLGSVVQFIADRRDGYAEVTSQLITYLFSYYEGLAAYGISSVLSDALQRLFCTHSGRYVVPRREHRNLIRRVEWNYQLNFFNSLPLDGGPQALVFLDDIWGRWRVSSHEESLALCWHASFACEIQDPLVEDDVVVFYQNHIKSNLGRHPNQKVVRSTFRLIESIAGQEYYAAMLQTLGEQLLGGKASGADLE